MIHIAKLITGGQTGVDRGVMAFAKDNMIKLGGWVPKGGWAEDYPDGPSLRQAYPELKETLDPDPAVRTRLNIEASDAVLLLLPPRVKSDGTDLAEQLAYEAGKPYLITNGHRIEEVLEWLDELAPRRRSGLVLNVGGPRESEYGRGEVRAYKLLSSIFTAS